MCSSFLFSEKGKTLFTENKLQKQHSVSSFFLVLNSYAFYSSLLSIAIDLKKRVEAVNRLNR